MRKITCQKCKEEKEEIEFEYLFFREKYNKNCKECQEKYGDEIEYYFKIKIKNETPKII